MPSISIGPSSSVQKLPNHSPVAGTGGQKSGGITAFALLFWITDGVREDRIEKSTEMSRTGYMSNDVTT